MATRGIDISRYQGKPDFSVLKSSVDYVIAQAGFGRYSSQVDSSFEYNYTQCKKYNIPIGVYWFSYASTPDEARLEARACIEVIKGKQFEYPIYYDIEGSACSGDVSGKCRAFCDELEKSGYFSGIYISRSPAQTYLDSYCTSKYALWLAEYGSRLNWSGNVGMWQNSSTGRFNGIVGNVDTDICYVDYPSIIKSGGFNGYPKSDSTKILDSTIWWKKGDKDKGIFAVKQRLKARGYTSLDDTSGFGTGTENAVKDFQKFLGYKPTGEIGENFIKAVMK